METFFLVGKQVIVLFLLMMVGVICNRAHIFGEAEVKGISKMVLYFVTPCVIVESFQRDMNETLVKNLLITVAVAFASYGVAILMASLLIHDKEESRQVVLRFAAIFGNCGFMSLPIEEALLGPDGVFYGAVFIAAFNVIVWTYGLAIMTGDYRKISWKKLLFNPGIIGTLIGTLVFVCHIKLPFILAQPVSFIADLNTPLPMMIIGYYLGNLRPKQLVENKRQYLSILIKLILVPAVTILMMWPFHLDKTVIEVCVIASAAPAAANTAMFAGLYGRDPQLGAQLVSVGTLFSLITIPTMVAIGSFL